VLDHSSNQLSFFALRFRSELGGLAREEEIVCVGPFVRLHLVEHLLLVELLVRIDNKLLLLSLEFSFVFFVLLALFIVVVVVVVVALVRIADYFCRYSGGVRIVFVGFATKARGTVGVVRGLAERV